MQSKLADYTKYSTILLTAMIFNQELWHMSLLSGDIHHKIKIPFKSLYIIL